jgi:hypothetical protein
LSFVSLSNFWPRAEQNNNHFSRKKLTKECKKN